MKTLKPGAIFWILSIQFFIVQLIVSLDWSLPYSLRANTISDLGNSACGLYSGRYVCSPLHNLMNASFIILGITMIAGSVLIYLGFQKSRAGNVGLGLMVLAGFGTALVGLFPENTVSSMHVLGAGLSIAVGGLSLLAFGVSSGLPRTFRAYSVISGVVCLTALLFFVTHNYLGIGSGGVERFAAHPITIWLIIFGIYILRNHSRTKRRKRA